MMAVPIENENAPAPLLGKMMKAVRFHGQNDMRFEMIPEPRVGRGQIKIAPTWCGICGSVSKKENRKEVMSDNLLVSESTSSYLFEADSQEAICMSTWEVRRSSRRPLTPSPARLYLSRSVTSSAV